MAPLVALLSIYAGSMVLAAQIVIYLIQRRWPALPVRLVFKWLGVEEPTLSLSGFDELLGVALNLPISAVLIGAGLLLFVATNGSYSANERRARRSRRGRGR